MQNKLRILQGLLLICFFAFSQLSLAETVGRVLLASGQVTAIDPSGNVRDLQRRSEIYAQDTIRTTANSKVQIRFIDNGMMTLNENSQLNIHAYRQGKPETGEQDKVLLELIEGGFRSLTGGIGKGNPESYKVLTPTASIGIRGTLYSIQIQADKLLAGVWQGGVRITLSNGQTYDLGLDVAFRFGIISADGFKGLLEAPSEFDSTTDNNTTESATDDNAANRDTANQDTVENSSENPADSTTTGNNTNSSSEHTSVTVLPTSPSEQLDAEELQEKIEKEIEDIEELEPEPEPIPEPEPSPKPKPVINYLELLDNPSSYSPYFNGLSSKESNAFAREVLNAQENGRAARAVINNQFYEGYIFDSDGGGRIFALAEETNGFQALTFMLNDKSNANSNEGPNLNNYGKWWDEALTPEYGHAGKIHGIKADGSREQLTLDHLQWFSLAMPTLSTGVYQFNHTSGIDGSFELNFATGDIKNGLLRHTSYVPDTNFQQSYLWQGVFSGKLENGEFNLEWDRDSQRNYFMYSYQNNMHAKYPGEFDFDNSQVIILVGDDGAFSLEKWVGIYNGDTIESSGMSQFYAPESLNNFSNPYPEGEPDWAEAVPIYPYLAYTQAFEQQYLQGNHILTITYDKEGEGIHVLSGYFTRASANNDFYLDRTSYEGDTFNEKYMGVSASGLQRYSESNFSLSRAANGVTLEQLNDLKAILDDSFDASNVDFGYWNSSTTYKEGALASMPSNTYVYLEGKGIELDGNAIGEKTFSMTGVYGRDSLDGQLGSSNGSSSGSFELNLADGTITNGHIHLEYVKTATKTSIWEGTFSGTLANGRFQAQIEGGSLTNSTVGANGAFNSGQIIGTVIGNKNDPSAAITGHQLSGQLDGNVINAHGIIGWRVDP